MATLSFLAKKIQEFIKPLCSAKGFYLVYPLTFFFLVYLVYFFNNKVCTNPKAR
jgi:hypothetical protein